MSSAAKSLAFELFRGGASVAEVLEKTRMSPSTVNGYLADFVARREAGVDLPLGAGGRVRARRGRDEIHGTARLKPMFLELNEEVSYDHIRVVCAHLQARG